MFEWKLLELKSKKSKKSKKSSLFNIGYRNKI
jgi:hypothetical protein